MSNNDYYPLYWVRSTNFGDALNPHLYMWLTGRKCSEAQPLDPHKIIACGSIGHTALPGDLVWGTGCLPNLGMMCDSTTQVLATRGPLTAEMFAKRIGVQAVPDIYGDPALLLRRFYPLNIPKVNKVGYIPHYVDYERVASSPTYNLIRINDNDILDFVRKVVECELIFSSALHGIVCAEAYGIPAIWVEFSDNVAGKGFKFRDYYLGTGRIPPEPLDWRDYPKTNKPKTFEEYIDMWEPPIYDQNALLKACPFDWTFTDYERWYPNSAFPERWHERTRAVAKCIPQDAESIIEFGAGDGYLREVLPTKPFKPSYTPSDIYARQYDYIVCDLNSDNYPDMHHFDTVVMIGVLEYINNVAHLFKVLANSPSIKYIIFTYDPNLNDDLRSYHGWRNNMRLGDLEPLILSNFNLHIRPYRQQIICTCARCTMR